MNHADIHPSGAELEDESSIDIAVIGMAGRFPGADNTEALWRNLRDGVESIRHFSDEELIARGVPAETLSDPLYVRASACIEGADRFDAAFFGYTPREAADTDPQHRIFLETAWEALERAGYHGADYPGPIGIYAGTGVNTYMLSNLLGGGRFGDMRDISLLQGLMNGNNKDSMVTTASYKLDLHGPGIAVQTACSTSLVAVHVACRALLNHETDMALAGGAWVNLLHENGYRYQPGAILSSDGRCRPFDAKAGGTVIGSGVGIVVLKRLADAQADGDTIHAVIKGSAVNNDGAAKIGYTAPSVEGQTEVIMAAHAIAGVTPDSIGYVEAHGTGTTLGDPIEIAALTQAFRSGTERSGYCGVGSVKSNLGHLDSAAGVTGLIKAVLALEHRAIPPSLHFESPNPNIDFENSPFYVNAKLKEWPAGAAPRRAGVSSFGIGGTNAHVVLEEAPPAPLSSPSRAWQLLPVSARTETALNAAVTRLVEHLRAHPETPLADAAYTLQTGRKRFAHRAVSVCRDSEDAVSVLATRDALRFAAQRCTSDAPTVAFMFSGQGSQYVGMAEELYRDEPVFRDALDRCLALLAPRLDADLLSLIFAAADARNEAAAKLAQTALTQPALFAVEYSLAQLWQSWGIRPQAMIGHSIGEYVAACLAGVFSLEDALALVALRGRMLQAMPGGAMCMVMLSEAAVQPYLKDGCDLAAVNGAELCVLSGPQAAIEAAESALTAQGVSCQRLHVSHAFHSAMMEPMRAEFERAVAAVPRNAPQLPFISNVSGTWIQPEEAVDPAYWGRHLRGTVRFADGLNELFSDPDRILLEVGPGETLSTLAQRHPAGSGRLVVSSLPHPGKAQQAQGHTCLALGKLWLGGTDVDWASYYAGERRRRVPLPTYPFERQSYWVEADPAAVGAAPAASPRGVGDWFYVPTWRREPLQAGETKAPDGVVLILADEKDGVAAALRERIGAKAVIVSAGPAWRRADTTHYVVDCAKAADYQRLLAEIQSEQGAVDAIMHLWTCGLTDEADIRTRGFDSLLLLAKALEQAGACGSSERPLSLSVVTDGLEDVSGRETLHPAKALLTGPCKVLPQEYPHIVCRSIDIDPADAGNAARLAERLLAEAAQRDRSRNAIAYRGPHRWVQGYQQRVLQASRGARLREGGVYLITGGLGGVGLTLASRLAETRRARLALVGRSGLPPREQWQHILEQSSSDDSQRQRIAAVLALEAQGAEVRVLCADVADERAMRDAVADVRWHFGPIHGVVHAAGDVGGGLAASKTEADIERVFAPKVAGTRALMAALSGETLDFVLLCSSLATAAGGLSKIDYVAANAYLDATARLAHRRGDCVVIAAGWDSWRDVGMAADMSMPDGVGIRPCDGADAFVRMLDDAAVPQYVVSTMDLHSRLLQAQGDLLSQPLEFAAPKTQGHPRPALQNEFVAPENELEHGIAEVWSALLGIDAVGINDNLFELGGDSLLGVQVLSRVRALFDVELHPAEFFRAPTIAGLAAMVEHKLIDEVGALEPEVA